MSDYRFGDDHKLNCDPDAHDDFFGNDFDEAAWVEVDGNMFVRERTCQLVCDDASCYEMYPAYKYTCTACGENYFGHDGYTYCPTCGAKVVEE